MSRRAPAAAAAAAAPAAPAAPGDSPLERALAQLGHLQLYQLHVLLLLALPTALAAAHSLAYVFTAAPVPFRCLVPECESAPAAAWGGAAAAAAGGRCVRAAPLGPPPAAPDPACPAHLFHPNDTVACEHFVYMNMDTIYAEFNLACREWRRTLVGTVRNAALPVALVLTGYVSDVWGRRAALCACGACGGALGLLKSLAPSYAAFLGLEFLEAALGYGLGSAAYVLLLESARPSLRALYACTAGAAYGAGGALLALAAWRQPRWRPLLRWLHAPALLLPLARLLLDESPRWLHARGRRAEAARVLRRAARWNKLQLDEELMKEVEAAPPADAEVEGNPWMSLLRSRVLRLRLAASGWCWAAAAFVYYGLTINSVALSAHAHANFALNMGMEVVASLLMLLALDRCGRRRSVLAAFLLCGAACVVPYFYAESRTGVAMFFVGKLSITFAFNSLYVLTAEQFPTNTRSSALAACSLLGRAGSVLAPQTPLLSLNVQAALYGAAALSAAVAALAAPETSHRALPAAARDAERLSHAPAAPAAPAAAAAAAAGDWEERTRF